MESKIKKPQNNY